MGIFLFAIKYIPASPILLLTEYRDFFPGIEGPINSSLRMKDYVLNRIK
jgi:hypothetical protein